MCPGAKESLSRFFAKTMGKIHYTKDGLCEICDVKKIDDGKLHAHVDGVEKPKPGKDFFYGKVKPATDTFEGEYLKELGWDTPEYGWTYEKKVLKRLIKLAEQRGYERGKRELSTKYGGQG